jgi:hypothetical protein
MMRDGRAAAPAALIGGEVGSRSHLVALVVLTALLLSGALPALPHGHPGSSTPSSTIPEESGCPCPEDHLDRQDNPASEICPICSLTRLAAQGPAPAEDLRATALSTSPLPPLSELLPERFLASAPEARGPPIA